VSVEDHIAKRQHQEQDEHQEQDDVMKKKMKMKQYSWHRGLSHVYCLRVEMEAEAKMMWRLELVSARLTFSTRSTRYNRNGIINNVDEREECALIFFFSIIFLF
jgi:hypothetical protein